MAKKNRVDGEEIVIKKYANRRLYNTDSSSYVTLDDLAAMVKEKKDFVVRDAKTGEDITHTVLTQIIFEEESKGETLLPINFLRQLIAFYGDGLQQVVPDYLENSMTAFSQNQEKFRSFFADNIMKTGAALQPLKPFEEMAKQNMAVFEQSMSMFSPFNALKEKASGVKKDQDNTTPSSGEEKNKGGDNDQLEELHAQLVAMQEQINKLRNK